MHFTFIIFIALEFLGAGQHWECQDTLRDAAVDKFPVGEKMLRILKDKQLLY